MKDYCSIKKYKILKELSRIFLVLCGAVLMAINLNTFVHSEGLLPGGFTGITLLLQEVFQKFLGIKIPFTVFYWGLNVVPVCVCFKYVGKKFTIYSCLMLILSGLLTDVLPGFEVTEDILLSTIFGGMLGGFAVCCCLFAGATSGGTDFIAIFVAQKTGKDAWNYIFIGNCIVLVIAGLLFGWNKALYSIIFQFTSTQVINSLYKRYQKTTLLVITDIPDKVYNIVHEVTNHDATLFKGIGCYKNSEKTMLYTVVSAEEATMLSKEIKKIDENAFINVLQTKTLFGRFFSKPND